VSGEATVQTSLIPGLGTFAHLTILGGVVLGYLRNRRFRV